MSTIIIARSIDPAQGASTMQHTNALQQGKSEELVPLEVIVQPHILNMNPEGDDSCPEDDRCVGHTIGYVKDGHSIGFFYSSAEEVGKWLRERGYQQVSHIGLYPIDGRYARVQEKPERSKSS